MSICCSVGYDGASINSAVPKFEQYDLACPAVCKNGQLNFWKSRCLERIGNPDIKCCYKGCKEAAKHPELKAKMDKILVEWKEKKKLLDAREKAFNSEFNKIRYNKGINNLKNKPKLSKNKRAAIIELYINGYSIADSVEMTGCNKSVISMYRKIFRQEGMDQEGNILL